MYTTHEYTRLKQKYGAYSSWAIWQDKNQGDSTVIGRNIKQLHSNYVLVGLNISQSLDDDPWSNFHKGPTNVRKLKYACNDTKLRGSYMTDLFKNLPEKDPSKLVKLLKDPVIRENVKRFRTEMSDIRIENSTEFVIFGARAKYYFNTFFKKDYVNTIVTHCHYSSYSFTDQKWVTSLWKSLGINQDYEAIRNKYRPY